MDSSFALVIFVAFVWIGSIALIVYLFWSLQKEYSEEKEAEIKEKFSDMEKDVANDDLDDLVNLNNSDKDGKS